MRQRLIVWGGAAAFGILGVLVALVGWHVYMDHQNLHAIQNYIVEQVKKTGGQ